MTSPNTATRGQLAKAELVNEETGKVIKCMFNPKEYSLSKTNTWTAHPDASGNVPNLEFGGGQSGELKLELLFDTYEAHDAIGNRAGEDVRNYTKHIWDLMKADPAANKPPPRCKFQWGSLWSFKAVVTGIDQRFTFFLSDGTPVRAILNISLKEVEEEGAYPRQNPTSGGDQGHRMRTVYEGETLSAIAYEEYGDPTAWRHLAYTNDIDDPRHLRPGEQLLIAPLPPNI